MLAYTNRFLAYAAVIRNLHAVYLDNKDESLLRQIKNLKLRLTLTRWMQIFGIGSLLLCVLTMFLIYIECKLVGARLGLSLLDLAAETRIPKRHLTALENHQVDRLPAKLFVLSTQGLDSSGA